MSNNDYSRDPDALYDDTVVAKIGVLIRRDGALGVSGDINMPLQYLLDCLDEAKSVIRRHHARLELGKIILTPSKDAPKIVIPPALIGS